MSSTSPVRYQGGRALTTQEANAAQPGDILWLIFQLEGQRGCEFAEAVTVTDTVKPGCFEFEQCEFIYDPNQDGEKSVFFKEDGGVYRLYQAVRAVTVRI